MVGNGNNGVIEWSMNVGDVFSDVFFNFFVNFGSSFCYVLFLLFFVSDGFVWIFVSMSIGMGVLIMVG